MGTGIHSVEVNIGDYKYRAEWKGERVGNEVRVFRDGVLAGTAIWNGGLLDEFPPVLTGEANEKLSAAIRERHLKAAWSAPTEGAADERPEGSGPHLYEWAGHPNTPDAANRGQMGNEIDKPSRQGEKEVGVGGSGGDPNTLDLGGQAIKPHRRAAVDGKRPTPEEAPPIEPDSSKPDARKKA